MRNITYIMISVLYSSFAWSAGGAVPLTEAYLQGLIAKRPPSVQQIESSFLSAKQKQQAEEDRLSLRLEGEGRIYRSSEILLGQFDGGVTESATNYSVGLVKPTRYGVDAGLKVFGEKATNAFVSDAATNGVVLSLSMDLYQDFLGRRTSSNLKKGSLSVKRAELEKKAGLKTFESNIRKLYWSLVANEERRNLLTSLTKAAEKQYRESVRKKRSGAADAGEVARFHSQWSTRQSNLLSLDYQKSEILRSLKELLPDLNGKSISLGKYNVEGTIREVLACTEVIRMYPKAPFKNTPYDEIVQYLEQEYNLDKKMTSRYSGPDLRLVGEFSNVGRGTGFSEGRENFYDDSKPRTSISLKFSMPLDRKKGRTKETINLLNKARYQAQIQENLSRVDAYHSETVKLITTLREVLKSQRNTNKYLSQSLKVSNKKYKQARISLQELISEQESHLQSQLSEIDSKLTIVNTLVDYFGIYTETPCKFNRADFGLAVRN